MRRRARVSAHHLGGFLDAFGDAAEGVGGEVADTATSIYNAVSDAGAEIGAVLKFVAPIVALWPGIGTALAVALEAAGAYAAGDKIDDAIIETASAAMPPGAPRAFFDAAADVTQTALRGGDVKSAALRSGRSCAFATGGERAAAAFDTGVAVARGQKISDATFRLARQNVAQNGPAALAAFDAAATIANGGNAGDAALAAARDYATTAGGPLAAAGFDGAVAIARGKSLQDAGFAALHALAEGNDLTERAESFARAMVRALKEGRSVETVIKDELVADVETYGGALTRSGAIDNAKEFVGEKLGEILPRWDREWDAMGSYDLSVLLGVAEPLARAAQAIMRDFVAGGPIDQPLLDRLTKTGIQSAIEKYGAAVVASKSVNESYTATKAEIRADQLLLVARMPSSALSYATAKAQQTPAAPPPTPPASATTTAVDTVAAPSAPSSPRHSVSSDVALGAVCAIAAVALFWWAKS